MKTLILGIISLSVSCFGGGLILGMNLSTGDDVEMIDGREVRSKPSYIAISDNVSTIDLGILPDGSFRIKDPTYNGAIDIDINSERWQKETGK